MLECGQSACEDRGASRVKSVDCQGAHLRVLHEVALDSCDQDLARYYRAAD